MIYLSDEDFETGLKNQKLYGKMMKKARELKKAPSEELNGQYLEACKAWGEHFNEIFNPMLERKKAN